MRATSQELSLLEKLAELGLKDAQLEVVGDAVSLRFPAERTRARLLADPALRQAVVTSAQTCGFSRVSLELPLDN